MPSEITDAMLDEWEVNAERDVAGQPPGTYTEIALRLIAALRQAMDAHPASYAPFTTILANAEKERDILRADLARKDDALREIRAANDDVMTGPRLTFRRIEDLARAALAPKGVDDE